MHHTFACLKVLKNICSLCVFGLLQIFFQLSNTCHRRMSWKTAPGERLTSAPRLFRTFASHKSHEDVSGWIIVRLRWAKLTPKDVLNLYQRKYQGPKKEYIVSNKKGDKLGGQIPCVGSLRSFLGSLTRFVHIWSRLRKLVHGCNEPGRRSPFSPLLTLYLSLLRPFFLGQPYMRVLLWMGLSPIFAFRSRYCFKFSRCPSLLDQVLMEIGFVFNAGLNRIEQPWIWNTSHTGQEFKTQLLIAALAALQT